jgi:hypothetical protein
VKALPRLRLKESTGGELKGHEQRLQKFDDCVAKALADRFGPLNGEGPEYVFGWTQAIRRQRVSTNQR